MADRIVSHYRQLQLQMEDGSAVTIVVDATTHERVVNDEAAKAQILKEYLETFRCAEPDADGDAMARTEVSQVERDDEDCQDAEALPEDMSQNECTSPKSKTVWKHHEVLLLLSLYVEHKHLFTSSALKQRDVWKKIAAKMAEKGCTHNYRKCDDKWRLIKFRYKKIADKRRQSGAGSNHWEYYDLVEEIMLGDPAVRPSTVISSLPSTSQASTTHQPAPTPSTSHQPSLTPSARHQPSPTPSTTSSSDSPLDSDRSESPEPGMTIRKRKRSGAPEWAIQFQEKHFAEMKDLKATTARALQVAEDRNKILQQIADAMMAKNT